MFSLRLLIVFSLEILAGAMPSISNRALQIPLERRLLNSVDPMLVQSGTNEKFLGTQRVLRLVDYTRKKYKNTFAAYERNTGSRHPLDTLSRSSSASTSKRATSGAIALENDGQNLWYGPIGIGKPYQDFTVDFDTGSSDLWVPDNNCEFSCDGHRKYDPSRSSTSRQTKPVASEMYGTGEVAETVYEDKVKVGEYEIDQVFGAALVMSPDFAVNDFPPDGLAGLAFSQLSNLGKSPIQSLNESGQLPESFLSFKLSTTPGQSQMIIGDADRAAFKDDTLVSVAVTKQGYWQVVLGGIGRLDHTVSESIDTDAVIDTGTTIILVSDFIASSYFSSIPGASREQDGPSTLYTVPCDTINSTTPTLTFGGRKFQVSADAWNLGPDALDSKECIAGMGSSDLAEQFSIIGDVFLQCVYTIFDFGYPPRVQFAELV